ncbi:MAG: Gfo/Idh/MocA family oxidoreductase [Planctomycetia bacterium]|nr:Gfo/Idh/MocA family oxidoreductase [Planctomycetia bacterium]
MPSSSKPLRVGLIGCGFVGRLHAERLRADPRVAIAVCCDPDRAAAERLAAEYAPAAAIETDDAAAIGRHRLDAVVICSPTLLHYAQVCAAFDRGIDVLCEKPLAAGREQIGDLIAREREQRRMLSVSYQRRYKSPYLTARRELTENAAWYGPLKQVHIFVCERWQQGIAGTWRDDPNMGAGYFGDAGSHQIDIVHYVTGQTAMSVLATSERRGSRVEIVTQVMARLTGGAGLAAHFVGDANHWREDIHFHCRDADLLLRSEEVLRAKDNRVEPVTDLVPAGSPDAAFIDAVIDRQPTLSPATCALAMYDWTAAVLESARSGEWVAVGERLAASG